MTYKTLVIDAARKTKKMAAAIEKAANKMSEKGWDLMTFSITRSGKAILLFAMDDYYLMDDAMCDEDFEGGDFCDDGLDDEETGGCEDQDADIEDETEDELTAEDDVTAEAFAPQDEPEYEDAKPTETEHVYVDTVGEVR